MAQLYTTQSLIDSIKARGLIPTSQSTFTNDDFLRFGTEEIQVGMLPMLISVREEFFVKHDDQSIIALQEYYPIQDRAVSRMLRDVLQSNQNPIQPRSELQVLARMEPEQIHWQRNVARSTNDFMYYFRDDSVALSPPPRTTQGTLRLVYHRRPSNLVMPASAAKITSIDSTTQVTVSNVPSTFTDSSVVDLVDAKGGFATLGDDLALSSVTDPTITFAADLPTDLKVGDYIALAGETPIPQIPLELQPVLSQRVVVKCLEALGDTNGVQVAQAKLMEIEKAAMTLISPRDKGTAKKIFSVNYYKNSYWG